MSDPNNDLEFADYEADDGSTVTAAIVSEDNTEVNTRTGAQFVGKDSVVIATDRPGVYDVLSAEAWQSTQYADSHADNAVETNEDNDDDNDDDANQEPLI